MEAPSSVPRLAKVSEGVRVWDVAAGDKHTLLLADGDCVQPIIYYSGQQVKEEEEQLEGGGGGCTKQPVLLPFCMNVSLAREPVPPEPTRTLPVTAALLLVQILLLFSGIWSERVLLICLLSCSCGM